MLRIDSKKNEISAASRSAASRLVSAVPGLVFALVSYSALSDELNINPGMWVTTTTMNSPLTGPSTNTSEECLTKGDFDPEKIYQQMLEGMPEAKCDGPREIAGNTMSIDLSCKMEGGNMSVTGSWMFDGDAGSGSMTINMNAGGVDMSMDMQSQGKRVGDC